MTNNAHELEAIRLSGKSTPSNNEIKEEEYSIPLCIDDIISICREYNKLGWNIQSQIDSILDMGVEESIKNGIVQVSSLPYIKNFLKAIYRNAYFGDAGSQSNDCIKLINEYEDKYKIISLSFVN